jgi:hypothetical protein
MLTGFALRRFVLIENTKDVSKITDMFLKKPNNQFVAAMSVWDSKFELFLFLHQDKQEALRWLPSLLTMFKKHCARVCMNVTDHLAIEVEGLDLESHAERLPLRNESYVSPAKPKPLKKICEAVGSVASIQEDTGKSEVLDQGGENEGLSTAHMPESTAISGEANATSGEGEHVETVATNITSCASESTVLMQSRSELSANAYIERGWINATSSTESMSPVPATLIAHRGSISNTTSIDSMEPPPPPPMSANELAFYAQFYRGPTEPLDTPLDLEGIRTITISPRQNEKPCPVAIIRILARALALPHLKNTVGLSGSAFGTLELLKFDMWEDGDWLQALVSQFILSQVCHARQHSRSIDTCASLTPSR